MATRKVTITKANLPKQWTTAKVRVNEQGKVQVKINPAKLLGAARNPYDSLAGVSRKAFLEAKRIIAARKRAARGLPPLKSRKRK